MERFKVKEISSGLVTAPDTGMNLEMADGVAAFSCDQV